MLMNFHTVNFEMDDYLDGHKSQVDALAYHLRALCTERESVSLNHNQKMAPEDKYLLKSFTDATTVLMGNRIKNRKQKKELRNIQKTTKDLKITTNDLLSEKRSLFSKERNLPKNTDSLDSGISNNSKKIKKEKKSLKPLDTKNYLD